MTDHPSEEPNGGGALRKPLQNLGLVKRKKQREGKTEKLSR